MQEDEEGKWKRIPIDTVIQQVKALQMESFKTVPEKKLRHLKEQHLFSRHLFCRTTLRNKSQNRLPSSADQSSGKQQRTRSYYEILSLKLNVFIMDTFAINKFL